MRYVVDSSNREQVVVCFHSVDEKFTAHEDFVCIEKVDSIEANVLFWCVEASVKRYEIVFGGLSRLVL